MAGETPITVVGNLTADPELRSTPTGLEVANLRIAVTPRTRQDDGDPRCRRSRRCHRRCARR